MNRKEQLKLKQMIKKQSKQERNDIIEKYIKEIIDIMDATYIDMAIDLEGFNKELESGAVKYGQMQCKIQQILKEDIEELSSSVLEDLMDDIKNMENLNVEIYETITSRDIHTNKLLKKLPPMAEKICLVFKKIQEDLKDNKNMEYIKSSVINKSRKLIADYNEEIIETALELNEYIDVYIESREDFVDFISKGQQELQLKIDAQNGTADDVINQVKHKQRLRVTYNDLMSFLKHKGFEYDRQSSTVHAIWKNAKTGQSIPLPDKTGTIPQGTASKILKQIGSNRNELATFLYS